MDPDTASTILAARIAGRRVLLGLVLPADPARRVELVVVADSSVAISDAIGGGLLDDAQTGACEGGRFGVYLDFERETKALAANDRAAVLLVRLGLVERAVLAGLRGDALVVGIDVRGGDCDIPAGALVAACQTEPRVAVDVVPCGTGPSALATVHLRGQRIRGRANRAVRLATTGRRLAALSSVDAQHQGASLLRLAMHPPGPPLPDRTPLFARPLSRRGST